MALIDSVIVLRNENLEFHLNKEHIFTTNNMSEILNQVFKNKKCNQTNDGTVISQYLPAVVMLISTEFADLKLVVI